MHKRLLGTVAVCAILAGSWGLHGDQIALGQSSTCPSGKYLFAQSYPPNACAQVQANQLGAGALPNGTTATTQAPGDNTTDIATDAFVQAAVTSPSAPIVLPNGSTATTQAINDNTTKVSTDAFVQQQLAGSNVLGNGSSATTQTTSDSSTKLATDAFAQAAASAPNNPVTLPNGSTATEQAVNDNTSKVATDSFVQQQIAGSNVLGNGSSATTQATADSTTKLATDAFVQNVVTTPQAATTQPNGSVGTTQSFGDNTTKLATDAFVQAAYAGLHASGGRLTPTANTPVITVGVSGATVVHLATYDGRFVLVYNGTSDVLLPIASNDISDTLPSTGTGVVNNAGVFDEWAVNVSGTLTLCHATNGSGGGWASDTAGSNTARGTGYTQIDRSTRSYPTNKNSIANCYNNTTNEGTISANQATFLGTFGTTAAGQYSVTFGGSASGGTAAFLGLWNYFNRVNADASVIDNGAGYTYSSITVRQARASTGNEITEVTGLAEDSIYAGYLQSSQTVASGGLASTGVGLDSTTTFRCKGIIFSSATSSAFTIPAPCIIAPQIGLHVFSANESGDNVNANTFDQQTLNELDIQERY